jgi:hypothetical protein
LEVEAELFQFILDDRSFHGREIAARRLSVGGVGAPLPDEAVDRRRARQRGREQQQIARQREGLHDQEGAGGIVGIKARLGRVTEIEIEQ